MWGLGLLGHPNCGRVCMCVFCGISRCVMWVCLCVCVCLWCMYLCVCVSAYDVFEVCACMVFAAWCLCVCVWCVCAVSGMRGSELTLKVLLTQNPCLSRRKGREGRREDHRGGKEEMKGWGTGVMGWEATRRREAGRGRGSSLVLRKPGCKTTHRRLP